jgi:hypothetical protein
MPFMNEYIPSEDVERFQIQAVDQRFHKGHHKPHWTIDRERNVYLRHMQNGREEFSNRHTYYFYWKGSPLLVTLDVDANEIDGGCRWHYRKWDMDIPESLKQFETEITSDLKEALSVYKVRGVYSGDAKFIAEFDF